MSRINISIIGIVSFIFLIFLCISLNAERYYRDLNPEKVKGLSKRLSPKPQEPLKDRDLNLVKSSKLQPTCEVFTIKDKNLTLLGSEKNPFQTSLNTSNTLLPLEENIVYPLSDYNSSSYISTNTLDKNLSLKNNHLMIDFQKEISKILEKSPITFQKNSENLSDRGEEVLDEIFFLVVGENDLFLEIEGHTDAGGNSGVNQWISQKRADRVKKYLIQKGILAKDIKAIGFGEDKLLFKDQPYKKENRRVDIYIKRR